MKKYKPNYTKYKKKINIVFRYILPVFFILHALPAYPSDIPKGYGKALWGMSVNDLKKVAVVTDAVKEGQHFAEHFEYEPDVYIFKLPDGSKIEYYFYTKKLYKIFILYPKNNEDSEDTLNKTYESAVIESVKSYGKQKRIYDEVLFGYLIKHNVWEDDITNFDIRSGAGYLYKVLTNKELNKNKSTTIEELLGKGDDGHEGKQETFDL